MSRFPGLRRHHQEAISKLFHTDLSRSDRPVHNPLEVVGVGEIGMDEAVGLLVIHYLPLLHESDKALGLHCDLGLPDGGEYLIHIALDIG